MEGLVIVEQINIMFVFVFRPLEFDFSVTSRFRTQSNKLAFHVSDKTVCL
jgi:hypothetical protein